MRRLGVAWPILALWVALWVALGAAPAHGHIVPVGVGMQTYVKVEPDRVRLEYNLGFSDLAGFDEILQMETSGDNILSEEEIEAWLHRMAPRVLAGLEVKLDGKSLPWRFVESKSFQLFAGVDVTKVSRGAFDTWFTFESKHTLGEGLHELTVYDKSYANETSEALIWLPRPPEKLFKNHVFEPTPKEAYVEDRGSDWLIMSRRVTVWLELAPDWKEAWKVISAAREEAEGTGAGDTGSEAMRAKAQEALERGGGELTSAEPTAVVRPDPATEEAASGAEPESGAGIGAAAAEAGTPADPNAGAPPPWYTRPALWIVVGLILGSFLRLYRSRSGRS